MKISLGVGVGSPQIVNGTRTWTPDDLPTSLRTNGGFWLAEEQTTTTGNPQTGAVTTWTDKWGVRNLTQGTVANRPVGSTGNGYTAAGFNTSANDMGLDPASPFSPAFWMVVLRYKTGVETTFDSFDSIISERGSSGDRVIGSSGTANLHGSAAWATTARKNGAAPSAAILPLAKGILTFSGTPTSALWGIGSPNFSAGRGWNGPFFGAIALGAEPTESQRQKLEGWAANKWGITLASGHPYENGPPRI